jgi:hypothetical protein
MRRPPGCRPGRIGSGRRAGRTPAAGGTRSRSGRSGVVGPRSLWRSTVATVVCETSTPSFMSSPRILRYPHLGFSRPIRRISSLIEGSRGGRPGRRDGPRGRFFKSFRCHRSRVAGPTRKLLHRSRESNRAAAARNARSAVVNRGRFPPCRRRIFSWHRSPTASRSRSSTPQRTSRRSKPRRSRYRMDQSIRMSLTVDRRAGERLGHSTDRVSLPHRDPDGTPGPEDYLLTKGRPTPALMP